MCDNFPLVHIRMITNWDTVQKKKKIVSRGIIKVILHFAEINAPVYKQMRENTTILCFVCICLLCLCGVSPFPLIFYNAVSTLLLTLYTI